MVNISFKLLILFLLISFANHAKANTNENLEVFDTNIVEFNDDIATYIVYFGDGINNKELSKGSFSQKKTTDQISEQVNRQKGIISRRDNTLKEIANEDYQLIHNYKAVPAMVIRSSGKVIKQLAKSPFVEKIGLDNSGGRGHLNDAIPQTNIDLVKALPLSGAGVEVAIIDSGLDQDHPDFANRVASQVCFASDCNTSIYDQNGHGTNVAGIIAGSGGIAPQGGSPEVTLHILKVLDASNSFSTSSQIVSALDHIITNLPKVSIINMSLGTNQLFTSSCDDYSSWTRTLADAVNQLNDRGVTLFASAGNEGDNTAITAPACLTNVIAVGATWDDRISNYTGLCTELSPVGGEITCFSNSSENVDIFAPGALITSTGLNGGISNFAGTSMASPLAASCAALLRQSHPTITPLELRNALVENGGATVTDSAGRIFPSLDCESAYLSLPTNQLPTLTRLSPQTPLISTDTVVDFSVRADDNEDGDISAQVTWLVNNVSTATIGSSFNHTFALGEHTVTAKVIDSANNEATLSWNVSVIAEDKPPTLTRLSPQTPLITTETILDFSVRADDNEDGDISTQVTWFVNNVSTATIGGSFNHTFALGEHTVTAKILDSADNEATLSWNVSVIAEDQPPTLTRLSPQTPLITTETILDFSVRADDNEDGDISAQVTWLVNNVSTAINGGSFNHTFALGEHTVTAKVLDSANNEAEISWEITVNQSPVVTQPDAGTGSGGGAISISLLFLLFIRLIGDQNSERYLWRP